MKYCEFSAQCAWGDAFTPNRCAYNVDKDDYECPMILQEYEIKMDKLCGNLVSKSPKRGFRAKANIYD